MGFWVRMKRMLRMYVVYLVHITVPHIWRRLVELPAVRRRILARFLRWIKDALPQNLTDNRLIAIDARADTLQMPPVLGQHYLILRRQAVQVIHRAL